jgi:hypothetical protein
VLLAAIVLLSKIWFQFFTMDWNYHKKRKRTPKAIEHHGWFRWLLYSILVFVFFTGLSFALV